MKAGMRAGLKAGLRRRFYPEAIVSALAAVMFVVTLVDRSWIEGVFHIDPDAGNGNVEWMIVGGLLLLALALGALATIEWRRAAALANA